MIKGSEELHPWMLFAPEACNVLIVGTFPGTRRNWSYNFFYPNKANRFWKILAEIAESQLQYFSGENAVTERQNLARHLKIALTDMGKKIVRYDDSSLDENIEMLEYMNILDILDNNPEIRKIFFTSANAAKWFNNYLADNDIRHRFPVGKRPVKSVFQYGNRQIDLTILHSPSPRAANKSLENLVEMYRKELIQ